jgi:hypothetical protein
MEEAEVVAGFMHVITAIDRNPENATIGVANLAVPRSMRGPKHEHDSRWGRLLPPPLGNLISPVQTETCEWTKWQCNKRPELQKT